MTDGCTELQYLTVTTKPEGVGKVLHSIHDLTISTNLSSTYPPHYQLKHSSPNGIDFGNSQCEKKLDSVNQTQMLITQLTSAQNFSRWKHP